jgi:hypothetical protein
MAERSATLLCAALLAWPAAATASPAAPTSAAQPPADAFQSPTGNIRCVYVNQQGVACVTLNNGLGAILRSFDRAYLLRRGALRPPAGRTLGYGRVWRISTFRCKSERIGMTCWSTLTQHGFFIAREGRRIF